MRFCGDLRGDVSALPPQKFQVAFYTYLCYIMTLRFPLAGTGFT